MRVDRPPPLDLLAAARAEAEPALRALLAAHPATAMLAAAPLTPVLGGLSNFGWRVESPGCSHFVRLAQRGTEDLGADHVNECRVLALACAAGIAPPVLRCDPAARLLVTEWVGVPGAEVTLPRTRTLAVVATTLAGLHRMSVPADLRVVDFGQQAFELEAALPRAPSYDGLRQAAARILDALQAGTTRRTLCHHDLHPLNLLFEGDGRLWLVDWEYAGLGDPAFDLASYASQHGLDSRQRARFAAIYAAAGGFDVDTARLDQATWVFDYVQWLWYRAALQGHDTLADRDLAAARVARLAASLRGRASRVLRCNNAPFADNGSRV